MNKEKAKGKICPFMTGYLPFRSSSSEQALHCVLIKCQTDKCMAWDDLRGCMLVKQDVTIRGSVGILED